jgi:hypothetical protein
MDVLQDFRRLLLSHRYRLTDHALEAIDEHSLALVDIIACISNGRLRRRWPRQRKYEVEGRSVDGRLIRVIIRLLAPAFIRIITVYEVD